MTGAPPFDAVAPRRPGRPEADLLLAFRGTAYFLRLLTALSNDDYDAAADEHSVDSRRRLIAAVGYDARGYARLVNEIRDRVSTPRTFDSWAERDAATANGATLPARALRSLVEHSAVHLRVEWRDLATVDWAAHGLDHRGAPLGVAATPWLRARQTWISAIDLGNGGSFRDLPPAMLERLARECLDEAAAEGAATNLSRIGDLVAVRWGRDRVTGPLPDVVRWLLGRGERNLRISSDAVAATIGGGRR